MAQCHGYFPLTYPHFLLLAAFWSQGCIRSSTWEGVVHTVFSSAFPETQIQGKIGLYSCAEKATGLSQRWDRDPGVRHSRLREQQHPRTGITQAQHLQGREGRGHSCLQGLGRSITNNASQFICLAGNVPGTSL